MNTDGKTNVKLPYFVIDIIKKDSITFDLKRNNIFNNVYINFKNKYKKQNIDFGGKFDSIKSFKLNKLNSINFNQITFAEMYSKCQLPAPLKGSGFL